MMILHGYYRSSAAYRVRIALNLKGLQYEQKSYHLRKGEQRSDNFLKMNPQGLVPTLETDDGIFTQSLAIIEYVDATTGAPKLIPEDNIEKARVQSLSLSIACDIHPLNNLRVLAYLGDQFDADQERKNVWYRHWIELEFGALERRLAAEPHTGQYCHGETPSLADICLVPQVYNARRFKIDMKPYPSINRIAEACKCIGAFQVAHPDNQPDSE